MNILKNVSAFILNDRAELPKSWKLRAWTLAQIAFGILWLEGAAWKVLVDGKPQLNTDVFEYVVKQGSENPVLGFYATITDTILLPNLTFFLVAVFIVELIIALMFILGTKIRFASLLAFANTLAIMLSILNAPHEWHWSYLLMLLVSVLFFVHPKNAGLGATIKRRFSRR